MRVEPDNVYVIPPGKSMVLSHGLLYVRDKDKLVCLELIPQKR